MLLSELVTPAVPGPIQPSCGHLQPWAPRWATCSTSGSTQAGAWLSCEVFVVFLVTFMDFEFYSAKADGCPLQSGLDIEMVGFSSHGCRWFSRKVTLGGFSCLIGFSVLFLFWFISDEGCSPPICPSIVQVTHPGGTAAQLQFSLRFGLRL